MGQYSRRDTLRNLLATTSLMAVGTTDRKAFAQKATAPTAPRAEKASPTIPDNADARIWRAFQNAPWVAGPTNSGKTIYVLWAPWCPFCHRLMKDVAGGQNGGYSFRWIGCGARDEAQRRLIAGIVKSGGFETLRAGLLREPVKLEELPAHYVDRVQTAELLSFALQERILNRGGFPTFVWNEGDRLKASAGYGGPRGIAFE